MKIVKRFGLALILLAPWCRGASDLAEFERFAIRAKQLGATHVVITDDLPPALWQFDTPGDPYPAWFIYQPGLLKIFPPAEVAPYENRDYSEKVAALLQARCEILRRHGLKAAYHTNEPQVLPEAFFTAHPELRGPRVDQPNRSRKARFAPCVDRPETLALYREAMQKLLARLPEVDMFSFLTTDSGSGLCWAPGLYPDANGPSFCERRPMEDRAAGFLKALEDAAAQSGRHITVDLVEITPRQWMLPTFDRPQEMARKLPAGLAIDHFEGPDGKRLPVRNFGGGTGEFYPVVGVPRAVTVMRGLMGASQPGAPLVVSFGDPASLDLNFRILEQYEKSKPKTEIEMLSALREVGVELAGKEKADDLLSLWLDTADAERYLGTLNFGPVLTMGDILARWINRPFVPFPGDLVPAEKNYYRKFLMQAKGEEQADDLVDIQAMRMYEGWGARLLVQNIIAKVTASLNRAEAADARLKPGAAWDLLGERLAALECFVETVDHAVEYQAQLDRTKQSGVSPDPNPPLGTRSSWDRVDLQRIARDEIDNTARLRQLLVTAKGPLIDTASTPDEETIRKLGPELPEQLKHKIDTMNAHWEDYRHLYTLPNP
ncbi:MAG TPA: hypothetical protein VG675_04295 [Bryobacteraceae bacterium]|nr:hypothetical protein [Bryobacteraceae bacterium]